ncbi:Acyl-CoA N-acyltransferase [Cordyceps fumosorosea ARSEF 2679]|uniref:Acyl-CoA N-acyltransferase n=1 Tax=Cordyceps fumosorosea (strain ARSEF 2679) TaxID=1081104 RepID=A0A167RMD9_CORFA|nr:Acyl-CoA N-acyltransferase [Cordyceps fumosorosea ARSEF 2679]OAA58737.1 Acyl-CoA N-acyltransferase [Cordyceps fumosorosea ARSEF 2679]
MATHPTLDSLTESQLQALYTAHYRATTARIRVAGGARPVRIPGTAAALAWASDKQMHNGVPVGALAPSDDPAAAVRAVMEQSPSPCHWTVWPAPQPRLEQALLRHGFVIDDDEPAMAAALDEDALTARRAQAVAAAGPGFAITPVEDAQALDDWVATWGGDDTPAEVLDQSHQVYKVLLAELPRDEFGMFVGRVDGKPVGTGIVFCAEGLAAVHYIATLAAFRRRGIGRALTLHAMVAARRAGYRIAVLTASEDGRGVYRALGFGEFGKQTTYLRG